VADESWIIIDDFPVETNNQLLVTFNDDNGAITLASFEAGFRTESNATETYRITAAEFDTSSWDNDGDGVSNLDELIAGTNPEADDAPLAVQATIEPVQDKTFRISWQSAEGAQFYRVMENPDGASGYTQISDEIDATTLVFDHRVALYSRVNARYIVQSCNERACTDSNELLISGTLENAVGYFKASNAESGDFFGITASLSGDGNTLAVGARGEDSDLIGGSVDQNDNSSDGTGAVYVFARINGSWEQQAFLKPGFTNDRANFGTALSLSDNGNTLAVGVDGEPAGQLESMGFHLAVHHLNLVRLMCLPAVIQVGSSKPI